MKILMKKISDSSVGWREDSENHGYLSLKKETDTVGWKENQDSGLYLCNDNGQIGWRYIFFFSFIESTQEFIAPQSGEYLLETWGASGSNAITIQNPYGLGGYTSGKIRLTSGEKLYVCTGRAGFSTENGINPFNGGGAASGQSDHTGGQGGGCTHISKEPGELRTLEAKKESVIMVAGGGGGAQNTCGETATAGHGGGLIGGTSENTSINNPNYRGSKAYGGTQTGPGVGVTNEPSMTGRNKSGSFGKGADEEGCGAGGGSGWYGGGCCYTAGGGGGSSYASSEVQEVHMEQGVKEGNGLAKITFLNP